MSRSLIFQNSCLWSRKNTFSFGARKKAGFERGPRIERKKTSSKKTEFSLARASFILGACVALSGIFYLYQVNSIATKGFELKEVESRIQEAEKERNQLKIREVELKSMYNIEKATENLKLITSSDISYVDLIGPVAMK